MSKIENLIKELCPEGVPTGSLGDNAETYTGKQLNKSSMLSEGPYYVLNGGIDLSGYTDSYNEESQTISVSQGGASAGYVNWNSQKFWLGAHCYAIHPKELLNNRFLYHVLKENEKELMQRAQGAGIPGLNRKALNSLEIPLPPLDIQKEIVRILDKFSAIVENLDKEIELRQKQYEYYREKLLTFEEGECEWLKVCEVCEIRGRIGFKGYTRMDQVEKGCGAISLTATNIVNQTIDYSNNTYITWAKYEESPEIKVNNNDIIICQRGSIGKIAFVENLPCEATINPQLLLLKEFKCNSKFLSLLLQGHYFQKELDKRKGLGTIQMITQKNLSEIMIPVPPLTRQQEIVDTLDKFEAMIANLKEERTLRQKQYEYYREKLLTFK